MITVDNVYARVSEGTERALAGRVLRYKPQGYRFTPAFKSGRWDGWSSMMDRHGKFPAGLLEYVCTQALGNVEISDTRIRPPIHPALAPVKMQMELMEHQLAAVDAGIEAGQGIIKHPVGAGKTLVLVELTRRAGVPALILTHRKDLLYQLYDEYVKSLNCKGLIGIIGDGHWDEQPITIATFQTINAAIKNYPRDAAKFLQSRQAILVDECHHIQAKTYEKVMQAAVNAYYRFGCSATPLKEGDKETMFKVTGWTGPIISEEKFVEERQVPADIFVIDYDQRTDVVELPWPTDYERGLVGNFERNTLIAELVSMAPKPALVLIERVGHGRHLQELLEAWYQKTVFIYGEDSAKTRRDALDAFRSGLMDAMVSSVILDEGVDLPNIRTLVLGGGGKAQHRIIQRIGRGMRITEDKDKLIVFDFVDKGKYIGAHYRKRLSLYKQTPEYTVYPMTKATALDALREGLVEEAMA